MDIDQLKRIVEAALLAAANPLNLNQLNALFEDGEQPGHGKLREALAALDAELAGRAVELKEVGSGFRLQIRTELMPAISRLWVEKPPRYSRALLETLAIIAYRQPITRADVEEIRGVSLSTSILRTLQERDWIRVVGHRDVPGRPELLGTTRAFLDYFNLKSLDELPTLAEIKDIDNLEPELELLHPEAGPAAAEEESHERRSASPEQEDESEEDKSQEEFNEESIRQEGLRHRQLQQEDSPEDNEPQRDDGSLPESGPGFSPGRDPGLHQPGDEEVFTQEGGQQENRQQEDFEEEILEEDQPDGRFEDGEQNGDS